MRQRLVERERFEEDLRVAGACKLRKGDQRLTGDPPERLRVGITRDSGDVDQCQVDVPQDEAVNDEPPARVSSAGLQSRPIARKVLQGRSAHVRIAIVGWRDEQLLDRAGIHPAGQIEDRARLVVGAAGASAAERLLANHCAGWLVVDVEVSR